MTTGIQYYQGMLFFLLLAGIMAIAFWRGFREKSLAGYSLWSSVLVALLVFVGNPAELVWLVTALSWYLVLVFGYRKIRGKSGRNAHVFHLAVFLALLPLILCKICPFWHVELFGFTGISYLTFRVVQILIEIYDGVITEMRFGNTLAFFLFFPSFSSGPIDRSRRFEADCTGIRSREEYLELCTEGFEELLTGAIYKFILAGLFYKGMLFLDTPDAVWFHRIGYAYAYGLYLFFDFAGYSRMAVGTAYVLGVKLPGNFKAPFLAVDMRDFWDRWHITLSHWFRDFIFTRFVMFASRKKLFRDRLGRACVGFLVNMGIMGIWHGVSLSYILYGLYHGALLAGTEVFQKKSAFYRKHKNEKGYRLVSWFVTMQMVFFGFYIFSGKLV